jgi:hypothetical protein
MTRFDKPGGPLPATKQARGVPIMTEVKNTRTRHRVIDPDRRSTGGRFVDSQHHANAEATATRRSAINGSRSLAQRTRATVGLISRGHVSGEQTAAAHRPIFTNFSTALRAREGRPAISTY